MKKFLLSIFGRLLAIAITFIVFDMFGLVIFHQYITTKMGLMILIQNELENIILAILIGNGSYNLIIKLWRKITAIKK